MTVTPGQSAPKTGCSNCVMRGLGLCTVLIDLGWERPYAGEQQPVAQNKTAFAARRTIFHQNQTLAGVPVICEGWATSLMKLSNGRRQILSIVMPGELVTCRLLFERQLHLSIDAVTRGSYRTFDLAQLRAAMTVSPDIFDKFLLSYNDERNRADQLIADLGRRTATGRIARLLLEIWGRQEKAGKIDGNSIEFPLRQTHIADATGLTTVYVSKVINGFRSGSLVEFSDRSLKILDIEKLRQLAA
ncbi:MAG: Crp/Fnr family transcriptional regulator [Pseudolabrys sp.]|nr:Crp/Fnr family transcriptional regulator [Pseudolabrys sp.]MDP2295815.1 Crp/Fnr family transcriptional regulator [Pseudolabrys sp.]